ncbi:MAG: hypothetical protein ACK559_16705, partial [bacterium]
MLGAFLFGAIVPRDDGLPEAIAHRVEDTVVTLFLPVFFAVTGLRTDLGVGLSGEMLGVTVLGRPVSAMSFPSAAPGRDLALLAELQGADL